MQTLLFNFDVLAGLKKHIGEHFSKNTGTYSPYFTYAESDMEYPFSSKGIVVDRKELQFLYDYLPAEKIGLTNRCAEQTEIAFTQALTQDFIFNFKTITEKSLSIVQPYAEFFSLFQLVVDQILPVRVIDPGTTPKVTGRGFSSHKFIGGVFLEPCIGGENDQFEYALNIVHEVGHQVLMLYQWFDKIIEGDPKQPIYSVIRKTERPAILSLHGLVANTMMVQFCRAFIKDPGKNLIHLDYCKRRLTRLISDQGYGISQFRNVTFTEMGKKLLDEMLTAMVS